MSMNPYALTPNASINRVKLIDTPGLPNEWRGQTAYSLLGREFFIQRVLQAFPDLARSNDVPMTFDQRLAEGHPDAVQVASEMGAKLGYVLLTLKRGDPLNRQARPEWDESYWTHWAGIERVIIGGGLVSGQLGARMIEQANAILNRAYVLERSICGATLSLVGCARHAPPEAKPMLVFDFGQTAVKRGAGEYENGSLVRLTALPSLPAPDPQHGGVALLRQMVKIVEVTRAALTQTELLPRVVLSVASYVTDGQPADTPFYGRLRECGDDVTRVLSEAFGAEVKLLHDGTAAAHAYAGLSNTAVITIGTALGVGFAPSRDGLCEKNFL